MTLFPLVTERHAASRETACGQGRKGFRVARPGGGALEPCLACGLAVLLLVAGCATGEGQLAVDSGQVPSDSVNVLEQVTVATEPDSTRVTLTGRAPLRYTVFPATGPNRILVYLQNAEVQPLSLPDPLDRGGVHRIYPELVDKEGDPLTRIVIELAEPLEQTVREDGKSLHLIFARQNATAPEIVTEDPGTELAAGEDLQALAETAGADGRSVHPAEGTAGPASDAPQERWEQDGMIEEFGGPFTRITLQGVVREDGYKYFRLPDPPRLVVDVENPPAVPSFDTVALKGEAFEQLRVGRYPDKVRFVLDMRGQELAAPAVRAEDGSLVIESRVAQAGPAAAAETSATASWEPIEVTGVEVLQTPRSSDVIIRTAGKATFDVRELDREIVIVLPGASIPESLQKPVEAGAPASAVAAVVPRQVGSGPTGQARVAVRMNEKRPYLVQQENGSIRVSVQLLEKAPELPPPPSAEIAQAPQPVLSPERKPPEAGPKAPEPAREPAVRPQVVREPRPIVAAQAGPDHIIRYNGKRISLDFKDADIQNVLRLIAEVSGKNIVISDAVQGKVTIRLMEVPWDMALDVILRTYGLGQEEMGPNILRIAPFTQLKKEREEALKADEALENVEPLAVQIVPVNYARAKDLEPVLARFRSKRTEAGILVDGRTNSIIIRDLQVNIDEMLRVIRDLDTQTPQVLIEAKIVELAVDFERELGVQWGALYRASPATGNATGLNFPNNVGIGGVVDQVTGSQVPGVSNPVINLPAAIDTTAGGALGLSLGSLTNSFRLDAQLSALEKQRKARVLSSPRVATLNNQEARIEQGQEVPYQTTSDEGTKTEFKDAKLRLSVTPQITFDRSIVMAIVVSNDTPIKDPTVGFIIQKKEAQTSALVKDGETAVIGGIFTDNDSTTVGGVPFFKDIPVVGHAFRKDGKSDLRSELVIFITPHIIPIKQERAAGEWVQ
ncbi:MAG: type IV pilus secretin PilQ [bacterium]